MSARPRLCPPAACFSGRLLPVALLLAAILLAAVAGPPGPGDRARPAGMHRWDSVSRLAEHLEELERDGKPVPDYLEAYLWWYRQRAYPYDRLDWSAYERAEAARSRMAPAQLRGWRSGGRAAPSGRWEFLGPTRMTVPYRPYYGIGNINGRVNGLAFVPGQPGAYYLASGEGGLWKTTDGGASWIPLSDGWPNTRVTSVAVHPTNSNIVFAGTGDRYFGDGAYGRGIMRSTDGGATWSNVGPASLTNGAIRRIVIAPDTGVIFAAGLPGRNSDPAASNSGLLISRNGGTSWEAVGDGSDWQGISISLPNQQGLRRVYAVGAGVPGTAKMFDQNGNELAWNAPFVNVNGQEGVDVAASRVDPDVYYLLQSDSQRVTRGSWTGVTPGSANTNNTVLSGPNFPNGNAQLGAFYNWSQAGSNLASSAYDWHITCGAQGGQDVVYVGLIDLVASPGGGATWYSVGHTYDTDASGNGAAITHNDQHAMAVNPDNPAEMLVGNDGGVYHLTQNGGNSWTFSSLNQRLGVSQFYHAAFHPTDPARMVGGTQDNASPVCLGDYGNWQSKGGGDGGFSAVDPNNPNIQYTSSQVSSDGSNRYLNIYRTPDQWSTSNRLSPAIGNDAAAFIYPIALDPSSPQYLYAGTNYLYRYNSLSGAWTARLGGQAFASGGHFVTTIAVAPSDGNRIYVGTSSGLVWSSADGGASWEQINAGTASLPNRWITRVVVQPGTPTDVLVTFSGTGTGHVWRCANVAAGGARTWSNVSAGLPDIPANTVSLDPGSPGTTWFVGMDVGVFYTTNGGGSWTNVTAPLGLPNVQVNQVEAVAGTGYLMAATWGRGMWRISTGAQTYSLAGRITDGGNALAGVTVTAGSKSAQTAADGTYTISDLAAGTYTVRPAKRGYAFTPATRSVTVGPSATGVDFTATRLLTLSGFVRTGAGAGISGVTVTAVLPGPPPYSQSATTAADGSYTITGLVAGEYTVTPAKSGFAFTPASRQVTLVNVDAVDVNFTGSPAETFSISGTVTAAGAGLSGVTLSAGGRTATTATSGTYSITGLPSGTYSVVPSKSGYTFTPASLSVTVGPNATGKNFTATATGGGDAYEPDDTATAAKAIAAGQTQSRSIHAAGNVDWAKFTLTGTSSITVETAGTSGDTELYLYGPNSSTTQVAYNDDISTTNTFSRITKTGLAAGTYYVKVQEYGNNGTIPAYTLKLTVTGSSTTYSISGTVTLNGAGLGSVTVTAGGKTATTSTAGAYTITGLAAGTYSVVPSRTGYSFTPASLSATVGPNATGKNFTAAATSGFSISGRVTAGGAGLGGVTVTASGGGATLSGSASPNAPIPDNSTAGVTSSLAISGAGSVASVRVGVNITHSYIGDLEVALIHPDGTTVLLHNRTGASTDNLVTTYPSPTAPAQSLAVLNGRAATGTWRLRVRDLAAADTGRLVSWNVALGVSGGSGGRSVTTAADGTYQIAGLAAGTYTVTPAKSGTTFTPASLSVTVGPNATGKNFTATTSTGGFSISGTVTQGGVGLSGATVRALTGATASEQKSASPGAAIPDGSTTGVTSSLSFTSAGYVTSARVAVNITHPYRGDLIVTLIHPDGTRVVLFEGDPDDGTANLVVTFPDQMAPAQSLSQLYGRPAAGTWKLKVEDSFDVDAGRFNSWTLTLGARAAAASAVTGTNGVYVISGRAAGTYAVVPVKSGSVFTPSSRSVTLGPSVTGVNFTGAAGFRSRTRDRTAPRKSSRGRTG